MINSYNTLGQRLRAERKRLGLHQDELGKHGGVTRESQSKYERGHRTPDATYLAGISNIGADVSYIVTGNSVTGTSHPEHRDPDTNTRESSNLALAAARWVATFFSTYIWSNPMTDTTDKYHSEATQRTLRILLLLGGHEINGLAPGEIAKAVGIPPSQTTRLLANLRIAGVAEQLPETERWRLAPRIVQIAIAHMHGIDKAQSKLDETRQRFSREIR